MVLASAGIFIVILNSESNPTYKISWIIPVALLPFFGSMLYLLSHYNIGSIASTKAVRQSLEDTEKYSRTARKSATRFARKTGGSSRCLNTSKTPAVMHLTATPP